MAACVFFSQGSKTWIALLLPIVAVFARLSSGRGVFLISITSSALFILLSTIVLFTFCKQKPIEAPLAEKHQPSVHEDPIISSTDSSFEDVGAVPSVTKDNRQEESLIASQDLYSENESMDHFSTTSSDDHSSDIEWPYNIGQRLDCSDGSISDEESLIEIAIPSGQFVSPEKGDQRLNFKCCKLSADFSQQESMFQKDFWADYEMNEEDNLIEIDIYMGSIKCSSFEI